MPMRTMDDLYPVMPWDAVDAAVFDVGNVLVRFDPPAILRRYLPDEEALWPRIMARAFRSPYWPMLDRGAVTLHEAAELMGGGDARLTAAIHLLMDRWPEMRDVVPEGLALLEACRARGKKTFVLSNYHHEAFAMLKRRYRFLDGFDGMAVSGELHVCKPDPAIYRWLTDTYALDPSRLLFVDDSPANVETALYMGWNALCYDEPGKLRRFFQL